MAEILNFNYMCNRVDLNYCKDELDKILTDLNSAMDLIDELNSVLDGSQKLFNVLFEDNNTESFRQKYQSLGDYIEGTQHRLGGFYKRFKDFYNFVAEEKANIENQISLKTMTEEDVTNLDDLYDFRLDQMEFDGENIFDVLMDFKKMISRVGETVHEMHEENKRDGKITKTKNPFQRGDFRVVK